MKFSQNFIKYQKSPLLKMSSIHIVGKAPILFNLKLKNENLKRNCMGLQISLDQNDNEKIEIKKNIFGMGL